jgi:hypothetical protein
VSFICWQPLIAGISIETCVGVQRVSFKVGTEEKMPITLFLSLQPFCVGFNLNLEFTIM